MIETAPDTTYVVLDESGNATLGRALIVGALVCRDIAAINRGVRELAETHRDSPQVAGKRQFRNFSKTGFHYSENPREIQAAFGEYLAQLNGYRAFLAFSRRDRLPDISESERCLVLYATVITDVFAYARTPNISFLFETNSALTHKFARLVEKCRDQAQSRSPRLMPSYTVAEVGKAEVEALSIIDYCMAYVSGWIAAGLERDPDKFEFTAYLNVELNLAVLHDFDNDSRSTRRRRTFH